MLFYQKESFRPENSVGYLARRVHQLGQLLLEPVFAAEGVTNAQWSTLVAIYFGKGGTCAELAREIGYDKGAMTRLVDQLAERGFVDRARDTGDRRIVNLTLTEEGRAVALRCKTRVIRESNAWLEGWDAAEIEGLIAGLTKLKRRLDVLVAETAE